MPRPIVLVGLPGAGKSTVGPLLAAQLGTRFTDLDRIIEAWAGKSVARIFAEDGEAAFRSLERSAGADQLQGSPAVMAPGGGYFMDPVSRSDALARGYAVYLAVMPDVAALRLGREHGRPLLGGGDPAPRLRFLLEQREATYLEAPGRVSTDGRSPVEVAAQIAQLARRDGGW